MQQENMNIVIVGHVDHGKSTIIGRLLSDTHSVPEGKLEQIQERCRRNAKPFEYAFLLDALKDEQEQGITIDSARCFFKTQKRKYIIIDAPGHIEFLKNMVTGASRAEAALLVIDAHEGIQENSKRHGYLLSMLGIRQICVLVNKMDLVEYSENTFDSIVHEYTDFLNRINVKPMGFIPISGYYGENIVQPSECMKWFDGQTVLDVLESFEAERPLEDKPFRMPVQGVYRFTEEGDERRIVAGTIETGHATVGDKLVFYPSGKKSCIKSIEGFNEGPKTKVVAGMATGFTLTEQIYVKRGEMAVLDGQQKPQISTRIKVNLFWLGKEALEYHKEYIIKLGTVKVKAHLESIERVIDASDLDTKTADKIQRHEVAECIFKLDRALAFDESAVVSQTSRFVIVDNYEIAGGGIILQSLEDTQNWVREKVLLRNTKWEKSSISDEERAEKYSQKSTLILITGEKKVGKKTLARALEKKLFEDGRMVYFLGIGNVLYGVDADIKSLEENKRKEHLRRLAEVGNILMDAGIILIVTAVEMKEEDLELMKEVVAADKIMTVWVGKQVTTDIDYDSLIPEISELDTVVGRMKKLLQDKGVIYKYEG